MDLDRFLNLLVAVFGAMGSLYVLKGLLALSPNPMERMVRTYVGFNLLQIDALAAQKADSIVGVVLVVIALVLAIVNIAVVPEGVRAIPSRGVALGVAAVLAGGMYVALVFIGGSIYKHQKRAVGRIITSQYVDSLLEKKQLTKNQVPSLSVYAHTLLDLQVGHNQSPRDLLRMLAAEVGKEVPADFDFSGIENQ